MGLDCKLLLYLLAVCEITSYSKTCFHVEALKRPKHENNKHSGGSTAKRAGDLGCGCTRALVGAYSRMAMVRLAINPKSLRNPRRELNCRTIIEFESKIIIKSCAYAV